MCQFATEMYEGKNIHYSAVDKKPLCSFSNKVCKQRRLNGYALCVRHILEDATAPFRRCAYVAKSSKQMCTQPIPGHEERQYCNNHMQVLGMLPKKERKKKGKETSGTGENEIVVHHRIKSRFNRMKTAALKREEPSRNDPDDPYAFPDPESETTAKSPPNSVHSQQGQSPISPTSSYSPFQTKSPCTDSGSTSIAKLYPELAEKLERVKPKAAAENKTKNKVKSSRTMNRLQTKIAQNKIKDKLKRSLDPPPPMIYNAFHLPSSLEDNLGLSMDNLPNDGEMSAPSNVHKGMAKTHVPPVLLSEMLRLQQPMSQRLLSPPPLPPPYPGPINRNSAPYPLLPTHIPNHCPAPVSPPYLHPGLPRPPSLGQTGIPHNPGMPQAVVPGINPIGLPHPSSMASFPARLRSPQTYSQCLTNISHAYHQQTEQALNHVKPETISVVDSDDKLKAKPPEPTILCSGSPLQSPTVTLPSPGIDALPPPRPPVAPLPPPPSYMHPFWTPTCLSVLQSKPQRLKHIMSKTEAKTKLKTESSVRYYSYHVRRKVHSHCLLKSGVCASDGESDGEDLLPWQQDWFAASSDEETVDDDIDDQLPFHIRTTKLALLRARLRRQYAQSRKSYRSNGSIGNFNNQETLALIRCVRDHPQAAKGVLDEISRKPQKPVDKYKLRGLEKRQCCYKNDDDVQCKQRILPSANHCIKHVMYNVDQQLFAFCTAKFSDNTQCCMPVIDVKHDIPLCTEHGKKADSYDKSHDEEKRKRPRKKTKPSALTRPPKKGKKKKNQRKVVRPQKPIMSMEMANSESNAFLDSDDQRGGGDSSVSDMEDNTVNVGTAVVAADNKPLDISESLPASMEDNLSAEALSTTNMSEPDLSGDDLAADQAELVASLSPNTINKTLDQLPLEQASKLLEEQDFHDVFNRIPDDAFDIFSGKNGEFEPTKEEADELDRALAAASRDVIDARDFLENLGGPSGVPMLEDCDVENLALLGNSSNGSSTLQDDMRIRAIAHSLASTGEISQEGGSLNGFLVSRSQAAPGFSSAAVSLPSSMQGGYVPQSAPQGTSVSPSQLQISQSHLGQTVLQQSQLQMISVGHLGGPVAPQDGNSTLFYPVVSRFSTPPRGALPQLRVQTSDSPPYPVQGRTISQNSPHSIARTFSSSQPTPQALAGYSASQQRLVSPGHLSPHTISAQATPNSHPSQHGLAIASARVQPPAESPPVGNQRQTPIQQSPIPPIRQAWTSSNTAGLAYNYHNGFPVNHSQLAADIQGSVKFGLTSPVEFNKQEGTFVPRAHSIGSQSLGTPRRTFDSTTPRMTNFSSLPSYAASTSKKS